ARPAIALAIEAAIAGRLLVEKSFASRQGRAQAFAPPSGVYRDRLAGVKNPHAQRRARIKKPNRQETILAVVNHGQFAQLALAVLLQNAAGEKPRQPGADFGFRRGGHAEAQSPRHADSVGSDARGL